MQLSAPASKLDSWPKMSSTSVRSFSSFTACHPRIRKSWKRGTLGSATGGAAAAPGIKPGGRRPGGSIAAPALRRNEPIAIVLSHPRGEQVVKRRIEDDARADGGDLVVGERDAEA